MEEDRKPANNRRKKVLALVIFAVLTVIGGIVVLLYLSYKSTHISTDDAYIEGQIHTIAPRIPGTVRAIYVDDNQHVHQGDLLVELDPADYEARLQEALSASDAERGKLLQADATLQAAKKQLEELKAAVAAARANLELQIANMEQAKKDAARAEALIKKETISRERYEKTMTGYDVTRARVKASREELKKAETALKTQRAIIRERKSSITAQEFMIKQKKAAARLAGLNAGYTKIYAPVEGYVTKKSVEIGNQVQPGQPLMALVPLAEPDIWVIANYKETQIRKIHPGQDVDIKVDTYSGKTFHGKVNSIMAGTGAAFSLFPPENATGNFVKVVQRVPVKITLNRGEDPKHVLRVGMSVVPTVLVK